MGFPRALFAALCARPDVFLSLFITIPLAGALIYRITDLFVPRLLSFFLLELDLLSDIICSIS